MSVEEQFKEKALEWLNSLEDAARKGGDFFVEHAPETVQQYLTFHLVESLVMATAHLFAIISALVAVRFGWKLGEKISNSGKLMAHEDGMLTRFLSCMLGGTISGLFLFFGLIPELLHAGTIWLAPNVFILEELSRLVK